jgi:hypothetical protein
LLLKAHGRVLETKTARTFPTRQQRSSANVTFKQAIEGLPLAPAPTMAIEGMVIETVLSLFVARNLPDCPERTRQYDQVDQDQPLRVNLVVLAVSRLLLVQSDDN